MTDVPTSSHEQWDELAAGYALHALEPDEELQFSEHLRTCVTCAPLLRDHELVAAQLASLAHADNAAAPAWGSIRDTVIADSTRRDDRSAPVVLLASRRRRQTRILGAAAAVLILAGTGVGVWQATRPATTSSDTQAVRACQEHTGCSVVRLHTPDGAAPGIVLVSDDRATMLPTAMAPAPAGKTYVLWQLLRNGGPTAVASFSSVNGKPSGPLVMPYDDTAAFAVSVEPAGVPPSQPTNVVAVGNTSA